MPVLLDRTSSKTCAAFPAPPPEFDPSRVLARLPLVSTANSRLRHYHWRDSACTRATASSSYISSSSSFEVEVEEEDDDPSTSSTVRAVFYRCTASSYPDNNTRSTATLPLLGRLVEAPAATAAAAAHSEARAAHSCALKRAALSVCPLHRPELLGAHVVGARAFHRANQTRAATR